MVCPSTSATLVFGSIPVPAWPPPVLQATKDMAQTSAKACKPRLFMTLSTRGEPRTLGGRGAYVNNREPFGVPEPSPERDQGAPPTRQDGSGGGPLDRPRSPVLQRIELSPRKRLPDRSGAPRRRGNPRRESVCAALRHPLRGRPRRSLPEELRGGRPRRR